jgi:tetratricopeptide (TPR) repeat protein
MAAADYVLHGRFLESEGRFRVDMTLRDTATGVGTPMRMDGKANEIFTLVDAVTERISSELDLDSLFDRNRPISEVATSSLAAFQTYQRGVSEMQDGRNQAAMAALQEAVQIDATFAMAHARLAEAHWNLGDAVSAKAFIEKANEVSHEHPLPLSERFQIHAIAARINDDPDTAIEAYRKLSEFYPSDPDVMLGLAAALESKGEMNQALECYRAIAEANPTYGAPLLGLGRMLVTVGRPKEAIPFLERAVESGEFKDDLESLGMLHSILGVAYKDIDDQRKAIEHFEISLSARRTVGDRRGTIATLVNMAAARRKLRQYDQASALLVEGAKEATAWEIPSMESAALMNLGSIALEQDRLAEALDYYRTSLDIELRLKQDNEIAYRLDWIAEVYRRSGLFVESLVYLEQASIRLEGVDEPREKAFNLRILADVQRARGQLDEAVQALLTAIPVFQERQDLEELARARFALSDIFVVQGRFAEALQVIEQGLEDFRDGLNLAMMNLKYADLLVEAGDSELAENKLDAALTAAGPVYGQLPDFEYVRGRLMIARKEGEASRFLRSASEQGRRKGDLILSGRASIALARALTEQGETTAARSHLSRILDASRSTRTSEVQASAALELAELELASGRLSECSAFLEEARKRATEFQGKPLLRRVHYNLLNLAMKRGDTESAERARREVENLTEWLKQQLPYQNFGRNPDSRSASAGSR